MKRKEIVSKVGWFNFVLLLLALMFIGSWCVWKETRTMYGVKRDFLCSATAAVEISVNGSEDGPLLPVHGYSGSEWVEIGVYGGKDNSHLCSATAAVNEWKQVCMIAKMILTCVLLQQQWMSWNRYVCMAAKMMLTCVLLLRQWLSWDECVWHIVIQ